MDNPAESIDSDVDSKEKLSRVPERYLSTDTKRPLQHVTDSGDTYKYALKPVTFCVIFVLLIELLERFSYYGIQNSQMEYLVGDYNPEWNANMTSVQASSFVSASNAIAMSSPFIGGIMADGEFSSLQFR